MFSTLFSERMIPLAQALYKQIAEYIRERIVSQEYPVGSQIPTECELAERLQVSRPTVRQALDTLTRRPSRTDQGQRYICDRTEAAP